MQEIRKICESQQGDHLAQFLQDFAGVLDPDMLARKLGFFKHPLYFQASEDRISFDQRRQLANMYMYSLDVHAQYRKMEQQKKKRDRKAAHKARIVETWRQNRSGKGAPRVTGHRVQQEALADHLRAVLAKQPGSVMLSVPAQNMPIMSLQTALSVPGHQPQVPRLENRPQLE